MQHYELYLYHSHGASIIIDLSLFGELHNLIGMR